MKIYNGQKKYEIIQKEVSQFGDLSRAAQIAGIRMDFLKQTIDVNGRWENHKYIIHEVYKGKP